MSYLHLTCGARRCPETDDLVISASDEDLAELTRTISAAYTARAIARRIRGEPDLALADLESALRHDPGNAEAISMRELVLGDRGDGDATNADLDMHRILGLEAHEQLPGSSYSLAGYLVVADFSPFSETADRLLDSYPLSPDGRDQAIGWAQFLTRMPDLRREWLGNRGEAGSADFDAVVIEIRAVARQIHRGWAMDEEGDYLPCRDERAPARI